MTNMTIVVLFLMLINFLNKKLSNSIETKSSFECGFENNQTERGGFNLRFFSLTVIFLLFDLEFTIIFPMVLIFKSEKFCAIMILIILSVGLLLEWNQGNLEWK